jgi:hypothetical protein
MEGAPVISETKENDVEAWLRANASKDRPAMALRIAQVPALRLELPEVNTILKRLIEQERAQMVQRHGNPFYYVPKEGDRQEAHCVTRADAPSDVPSPEDYVEDAAELVAEALEANADRPRAQGAQGRAPAKQKGYGNRQPCRHCGRMLDGRGKNAHEFACGRKAKAAPPSNASVEVPEAPPTEVTAGIEAKDSADRLIERIQLCARTVKEMRRLAVEAGLRVEFEANNGYLSLDIYWKEVSS